MRHKYLWTLIACWIAGLVNPCRAGNLVLEDSIGGELVAIQKSKEIFFVAQSDILKIVDSSKTPPVRIRTIRFNGKISSIAIHNSMLFVTKELYGSTYGEILQYDIRNPADPVSKGKLEGHLTFKKKAHLIITDNFLMVDKGENSDTVDIYDLSQSEPVKLMGWKPGLESASQYDDMVKSRYNHDVNLINDKDTLNVLKPLIGLGDVLSVADNDNSVLSLDTSQSLKLLTKHDHSLSIVYEYQLDQRFDKIRIYRENVVLYGDHSYQIVLVDVSDHTSFTCRSRITLPSPAKSIDCTNDMLLVVGSFGLLAFDIKDIANPKAISNLDLKNKQLSAIVADGSYAYIAGKSFYVVALSSSELKLISCVKDNKQFNSRQISKLENVIYSIGSNDLGYETNAMIDVSNTTNPIVGYFPEHLNQNVKYVHITVFRSLLILIENSIRTGFNDYDIALYNPQGSRVVEQYNGLRAVNDIAANDQYLYIADGEGGLKVFRFGSDN